LVRGEEHVLQRGFGRLVGGEPRRFMAVAVGLSALLSLSPASHAAARDEPRTPWRLEDATRSFGRLSVSGDFRIRYEYLDNQFRAGRPGSDQLLVLRTRLRAELRLTDWLSAGAELQDSRAYLADDNTLLSTGIVNTAELLRAYLEASFDDPFGGSHQAQLGRVTMDLGSRRLVARNRFRNTSNAFTGLDWTWRSEAGRELRMFYTLPVQRLPQLPERLRGNEVEFDRESFDYQFWGLFFRDELPWGDTVELYGFGLNERGAYDLTQEDATFRRRLGTPGFRLLRAPRAGHFDYELESALQVGSSRLRLAGRTLDHRAWFVHLTLGHTFARRWSPRLLVHYDYASGDSDPSDGRDGRFDSLFGARRFEWGPTSLYGPFARSNINTPGLRLEVTPRPRWSAFVDYRAVWLAQRRDVWVGTGVQDPTGNSGSFVGQHIELRVRFDWIPGNVRLELGYAHLFAGEFIERAPNSNGGDTNYVYTQMLLEF